MKSTCIAFDEKSQPLIIQHGNVLKSLETDNSQKRIQALDKLFGENPKLFQLSVYLVVGQSKYFIYMEIFKKEFQESRKIRKESHYLLTSSPNVFTKVKNSSGSNWTLDQLVCGC